MMHTPEAAKTFLQGRFDARFGNVARPSAHPFVFASAPGRIELAGNHTDHQGGQTISAAIDQRAWALAAPNNTDEICVSMEGFGEAVVPLDDLEARADERGTSLSLVRGMAAAYARGGKALCGFDMVTHSDIPVGGGVSSSAAFEVLIGAAIRAVCDTKATPDALDPATLALDSVWAERTYFGKPCGMQDQFASSYGGIATFDFSNEVPRVFPIAFDMEACGYALYLIDSKFDHSQVNEEYAAIPTDMHTVARHFGCTRLEDVSYRNFLEHFADVREKLGDRPALRALHYFEETQRVVLERVALEESDFEAFLAQVRLSGTSSAQFLQNVSPRGDGSGESQPAMVILALCAHLLDGHGAYRIHGGGFGGSVLAFVPEEEAASFKVSMNALLGYDACTRVSISARGAHAERMV